jgi:hypothetical protein
MLFITQGKTNWKFLLIVIILAVIVGSIVLWCPLKEEQVYQTPEIKKTETTDWKTYRNEEYGFEIKYPETWNISEKYAHLVEVTSTTNPSEKIIILKSSGPPPETMDMEIIESKMITVDNITATRELMRGRFEGNKDQYYLRVFIPKLSLIYHADFNKDDFGKFSLIYDQMLSTFKFIEVLSSDFKVIGTDKETGWNIGRSDNYGFEIKYPSFISPLTTAPSAYLVGNGWTCRTESGSKGEVIASFVACQLLDEPSEEYSFNAELRIGANSNPNEVKNCLNFWNMTPVDVNINGEELRRFETNDAGLGNRAGIDVYRTIHNNICFSIEKLEYGHLYDELEASSSPHYNYEYSQKYNSCRKITDQMLSTFRFLE